MKSFIRKEYIKSFIVCIAFLVILCFISACTGNDEPNETGDEIADLSEAGNVSIISGGNEYAPLKIWIYSLEDGLAGDGERKQVKDVASGLSIIPLKDDFKIVVGGKGRVYGYSLYNNKLEELYHRRSELEMPGDSGEYIISFEVSWGNDKRYEGYQYFIKVEK